MKSRRISYHMRDMSNLPKRTSAKDRKETKYEFTGSPRPKKLPTFSHHFGSRPVTINFTTAAWTYQNNLMCNMASTKKKRIEGAMEEDVEDLSDDSGGEDDGDSESDEQMDEEVQIDFEARMPEDCDAGGMKTLLQQVFLKAHVNVPELTDTLISQNYVGSVMKQPYVAEEEEEDEDDDMGEDSVLALTSVLNLTEKKDLDCVKQIKTMLGDKCRACVQDKADKLAKILNDPDNQVGYLISERFLNLPPNLAVPMFESLMKEMDKACTKNMKYKFSHYLMICKTFEVKTGHNQKQMFFSNSEEELFHDDAEFGFSYSVEHERDEGVEKWSSEEGMKPFRTVIVFSANKFETVLDKIKDEVNKT